jgi:2-polyprenyl-3-methyl-5-hydroxy-6-metoxy-1,4-benzoquinol methylase
MSTKQENSGAIDWHSQIAAKFDDGYSTSRLFRERLAIWKDLIARYSKPESRVLDAGCGAGTMSFVAAGKAKDVVAFDGSAQMIEICRRKQAEWGTPNVVFEQATLAEVGRFGRATFDLVLCSSVLEYVDDLWGSIDQLANMLAPGGVLLLSMPNGSNPYRWFERLIYGLTGKPRYYAHVRHVPTAGAMVRGFGEHGMEVVESRHYANLFGRSGANGMTGLLFVMACRRRG